MLSGQDTWRARTLNSGGLKGEICRLLERTPDFQRESTRPRKKSNKCFRRTESLIKRSKDYEEGKCGSTECYNKTTSKSKNIRDRGERDHFKSVAKPSQCLQSPHVIKSGIQTSRNFEVGIRNPVDWDPESTLV